MTESNTYGWDFPNLAYLWDYKTRAIIAGADRLEALSDADRELSLTALSERVRVLTSGLDDDWLVASAFFMIEDLYKSYFRQSRWTPGVRDYIAATAGVFMEVLAQRGFVLHYVVDNVQSEANLDEMLTFVPLVFQAAGILVVGPQLMALEFMQQEHGEPRDVDAIPLYRNQGHSIANWVIARLHEDRRSSVYLNVDLDDDNPALSLDVALSQSNAPKTIVVFRDQAPVDGSIAGIALPPGVTLPNSASD